MRTILFFLFLCPAICPLRAEEGDDPRAYEKAMKDYLDTREEMKRVVRKIGVLDPAFESARLWLEKRPATGTYRRHEEKLLSDRTDDEKALYREWASLMRTYCVYRSYETELKRNREFERIYAFFIEKISEAFARDKSEVLDVLPDTAPRAVAAYKKLIEEEKIVSKMIEIQDELGIPEDLKTSYENEMRFSAVFDLYDTYFRLHNTGEIKSLLTELQDLRYKEGECMKKLAGIRPDWRRTEKGGSIQGETSADESCPAVRSSKTPCRAASAISMRKIRRMASKPRTFGSSRFCPNQ